MSTGTWETEVQGCNDGGGRLRWWSSLPAWGVGGLSGRSL